MATSRGGCPSNAANLNLNFVRSEKKIQKSVEKLLKNYPPKKQQKRESET